MASRPGGDEAARRYDACVMAPTRPGLEGEPVETEMLFDNIGFELLLGCPRELARSWQRFFP